MKRLLALLMVAVAAFLFILVQCARDLMHPALSSYSASLPDDATPTLVALKSGDAPNPSAGQQRAHESAGAVTPTPRTPTATVTVTPTASGPLRYTVREGDWIYKIARQFAVSPDAILAANPDIKPSPLIAGQILIIPGAGGPDAPAPQPNPTRTAARAASKTATPSPQAAAAALQATGTTPTATSTRRPTSVPNLVVASGTGKRYISPPAWILGPMWGSAEDDRYINDLLWQIDDKRIPITAFHFDSDRWQTCANNGEFRWGNAVLDRMRGHNPPIRAIFWILPFITKNCPEYGVAASKGFFVRGGDGNPFVSSGWQGTGSWIDFNNPEAVAYWHSLLDRIFVRAQGVIGGFYTDDLEGGLGSWYSDVFVRDLLDYTRSKVPDGDVIMKGYGLDTPSNAFLSKYGHIAYVNDLDSSFTGMREGIRRVLSTANLLPAPFNELTGYAMRAPDGETYARRIHWGALQPVMENDNLPKNAVPWDPQYPPQVLASYRYYATLHWELVPYFHSYDQLAYRNNSPIFQQTNAARYSTGLGKELFVQYVTDNTQNVDVALPAGQWINYWNEQQVYTGPTTISYPVPLGREPIFVRNGAIIPMQVRDDVTGHGTTASVGALTVNVFPNGHSTFVHSEGSKSLTFDVEQAGNQLTLCTSATPSRPLIYRIARWNSAPAKVTASQGAVGVNTGWGTPLPPLGSEAAVDGSGGGWFYDAARQHLIVKLTQVGSHCP